MVKEITSVNNSYIKELNKLKIKKYRDELGKFLVEGYHLVEEAKGTLEKILTCEKINEDDFPSVEIIHVTKEIIEKLSETKSPQGIIGVCLIEKAKKPESELILALDGIQDPGNMGTIIRSAISFGATDIILSKDSVDIYNEKVLRATQGGIFKVNIIRDDLVRCLNNLKKEGYKVIATALKDAKSIDNIKKDGKIVLVMGNEGNGISDEVLQISDERAYIPINEMESLNVAVACGICLYEFRRK